MSAYHLFTPLALDLPKIELQLLALQDIAISAATLARPGGDAGCGREEREGMGLGRHQCGGVDSQCECVRVTMTVTAQTQLTKTVQQSGSS